MAIEIIPASPEHTPQIVECSWNAFKNGKLQQKIFNIARDDVEGYKKLQEFRVPKLRMKFDVPGCHAIIAVDKDVENGEKVLGYAVWYEEDIFKNESGDSGKGKVKGEDERKEEEKTRLQVPECINAELLERIEAMGIETRKEYLSHLSGKIWYLAMLGVEPAFSGRGIASKLVRYGTDKTEKAALPAYLESTDAGFSIYMRQGFEELGKKDVLGDGSYWLTIMLKMPNEQPKLDER
ncbi:hypothetical protein EJ08DRAFT_650197 [Tothia fuscella]|uniref:N-acetyltransferase domain-containing protein n=1 Tax=Tothia fuscella TaxID=1048955 RepID=A0A9P4TYC4_9PEZI|nr:hypothetical protein EJ08DRAFT_650197 [Tothia fuscella]